MNARTRLSMLLTVALIAAVAIATLATAQGKGRGKGQGGNRGAGLLTYLGTLPVESVSAAEVEGLVFTREEEKLARDVYTALGAKWNLKIFANIARAEQTHMDATKAMLDRYQIADPAADLAAGAFRDARLQLLYNDLVAKGNLSIADALKAGATIEDLDIRDLTALVASSDNQDLDALYQNLAKGSRNHLRAFAENLRMQSIDYAPQYLDKAAYDAIVASEKERGVIYDAAGQPVAGAGGSCDGSRKGRGRGNGNGPGNGSGQGGNGSGDGTCDGSGAGNGQGNGKP